MRIFHRHTLNSLDDNDSHYRIKLAGYEAYQIGEAKINHKGSQTQNADPNKPVVTSQMFEKNREYYSRKWGGWPGDEKYIRPFNDPNKTLKDW
jgi:GT2 family glycosyltransferase